MEETKCLKPSDSGRGWRIYHGYRTVLWLPSPERRHKHSGVMGTLIKRGQRSRRYRDAAGLGRDGSGKGVIFSNGTNVNGFVNFTPASNRDDNQN